MRSLHRQYTWREYLRLAEDSNIKLEYRDGEIFAMAGGTPDHAALTYAVGLALGAALAGGPCRGYSPDLRVRVEATGLATYPDVTIICGSPRHDPDDRNTLLNPTLIVEVTSDSTEAYDRGEKFDHYRRIPSLQEVVFVSHRQPSIEVFRRPASLAGTADWERSAAGPGQGVALRSVDARLEVDALYAGIGLPSPS